MKTATKSIGVLGMTCGGCERAVTSVLEALPNVAGVRASSASDTVEISYGAGQEPDWAAVEQAIDEAGFDVAPS